MGYLRLYQRYWKPFRSLLPKLAQRGIAGAARQASRWKPGFEVYADVIQRAALDREHFWSGATTFWNIAKEQLVLPGSVQRNGTPAELVRVGMIPEDYFEPD